MFVHPLTAELWDGPSSKAVAAFEFVKAQLTGKKPTSARIVKSPSRCDSFRFGKTSAEGPIVLMLSSARTSRDSEAGSNGARRTRAIYVALIYYMPQ
jgi:hypothetical protein